jgi:hypothetical protein
MAFQRIVVAPFWINAHCSGLPAALPSPKSHKPPPLHTNHKASLVLLQYLGDFVGEEQLEELFGGVVQSLGVLSTGGLW